MTLYGYNEQMQYAYETVSLYHVIAKANKNSIQGFGNKKQLAVSRRLSVAFMDQPTPKHTILSR